MAGIDRIAPVEFIRTAYQPDDWVAVFLKSYETGQTAQRVSPCERVMTERFQRWLRAQNAAKWNIYISANAVEANQRSRSREAVRGVRHVLLDVDRDGPQVLATIVVRRDLPPPSYVLHSSPGRIHVLWRVSGFTVHSVEAIQKRLAQELHADAAATPCTQTTRLPGFFSHKRVEPYLVTIDYRDVTRLYAPTDFPPPVIAPPTPRGSPPPPSRRRLAATDRVDRARRYLAAVPPAIAGQHGDLHTFRVCCRLVRGFALPDQEAFALLAEWNTRCEPPWSERELADKVRRARRYGREPIGGLLGGEA